MIHQLNLWQLDPVVILREGGEVVLKQRHDRQHFFVIGRRAGIIRA
jgi:hypothetical protein